MGYGIYFSDFAATSFSYGKNLIISRVLVGRPYVGDLKGVQPGYQSKIENPNGNGHSNYLLLDNVAQILPVFQLVVDIDYQKYSYPGSWYTPSWTSRSRRVAYPTFQGSGKVLGYTESSEETNEKDDPEADAQKVVNFNVTESIANIQVKLADGTNLLVKLNHSHKVSDLKTYIETARPKYKGATYSLMTTFPKKEISDDSSSISAAGLIGAAVLQRLKA